MSRTIYEDGDIPIRVEMVPCDGCPREIMLDSTDEYMRTDEREYYCSECVSQMIINREKLNP